MKSFNFLFVLMSIPAAVFSQTSKDVDPGSKATKREAVKFYLKKTDLSRSFIKSYISLIPGRKDSIKANETIKQLIQSDQTVFSRLMRINLEWKLKIYLLSSLDFVSPVLNKSIDSAYYYYVRANYYGDSMMAKTARKLGFVWANAEGSEIVDWGKMNTFKWYSPKKIEQMHFMPDTLPIMDYSMKDSTVYYYKKAIEIDPGSFYYLADLLSFLFKLGEGRTIQEIVNSKLNKYTAKQKKLLEDYFAASYLLPEELTH